MCFLFGKQNSIIPKLNSDWLIPIKVHPSFKKNRMKFYPIKVLQRFWSKFSLTVVTVKNPSKTLTKKTWSKKTLIVTTGLYSIDHDHTPIFSNCDGWRIAEYDQSCVSNDDLIDNAIVYCISAI
jgi:hypothetical protein